MTLALEVLAAVWGASLVICLHQFLRSRLLCPSRKGSPPIFAVVPAAGEGDGLEHTLRHLRLLREEGLSAFTVVLADGGLTPAGLDLVRALCRKDPTLLFCPAEEVTLILQRKDQHGCNSL